MSSRGGPSSSSPRRVGTSVSPRPSDIAALSSNRFAERRQERMRGAGTAVAIQRDFQFKLPAKRAAPSATSSSTNKAASTSTHHSQSQRPRAKPPASGPKQRVAVHSAEDPTAPQVTAQQQDQAEFFRAEFSPPPFSDAGSSTGLDASASIGVGRRVARLSGPISSTPAASRIRKQPVSSHPSVQRSFPDQDDDQDSLGSQLGDDTDAFPVPADDEDVGMIDPTLSRDWDDAAYTGVDESLPMIPSPAASSSHIDTSIPRTRPSIAGTSVSHLSIADTTHGVDSPAAHAAQRNLITRQQRRQPSPGIERQRQQQRVEKRPRGRPPKSTSTQSHKPSRVLMQPPSEADQTALDRTIVEQNRRGAHSAPTTRAKEMQRRLKRALSLVFSPSDQDGADVLTTKKRKSARYLNDVDIIWSLVDEELRLAIEEQPAKAPFLALKSLRKSVRANFLNLSEKTDNRTTLISQLIRVRKQKRALRQQVFKTRTELGRASNERGEREKELIGWEKEVKNVTRVNSFLDNLSVQAQAWT
ncbi:uncharacterized protein MEPE_04812 [Melanopsichium pennsylvanicum]|uniref:Uncharacterized protein n=2 Tax=Melanopsichium pennsylvanicum TaxID=63383 RepID=A0AAJ4XPT3_9BASI|nr:putative protein [Melanopsichium pennsylvanicum 4]SNX86103.1 uncharacterized protein MEPE_04812 [Melanopsichium pennsylvanicum]